MNDNQKTDAMYLARELATLQVMMAREEGTWLNMTEEQRSVIKLAKKKGQEYIEKYGAEVKRPHRSEAPH